MRARISATPARYAVRSRLVLHSPTSPGHRPAWSGVGASWRDTRSILTAVSSPSNVMTTTQKPLVRSAASCVTPATPRATRDPNLASDTSASYAGGPKTSGHGLGDDEVCPPHRRAHQLGIALVDRRHPCGGDAGRLAERDVPGNEASRPHGRVDLDGPHLVEVLPHGSPRPVVHEEVVPLRDDRVRSRRHRHRPGHRFLDRTVIRRSPHGVGATGGDAGEQGGIPGAIEGVDRALAVGSAERPESHVGEVEAVHRHEDGSRPARPEVREESIGQGRLSGSWLTGDAHEHRPRPRHSRSEPEDAVGQRGHGGFVGAHPPSSPDGTGRRSPAKRATTMATTVTRKICPSTASADTSNRAVWVAGTMSPMPSVEIVVRLTYMYALEVSGCPNSQLEDQASTAWKSAAYA